MPSFLSSFSSTATTTTPSTITTNTTTTTTSISKKKERDLIALRKLRHDNAPKAARLLRMMELSTKRLLALHKRMDKEAIAIAGKDYKEDNDLTFFEVRSQSEREDDGLETFEGEPGLKDLLPVATDAARCAAECAAEREPPFLPSE
jgi:hypothetical protein